MHDTHLLEKLYKATEEICRVNSIARLKRLKVEVDEDSHLEPELLLTHLRDCDSELFGDWTEVVVDHVPCGKLTAVITEISGESSACG